MLATYERGRTIFSGYLHTAAGAAHASDAVAVQGSGDPPRTQGWVLGHMRVAMIAETGPRVVQPAPIERPLRESGNHFIGTILRGSGSLMIQDRTIALRPGVIALYSAEEPFVLRLDDRCDYLVTELARDALSPHGCDLTIATANPDLAETPAARMVAGILAQMPRTIRTLSTSTRAHLADAVTSLLRTAVDDSVGTAGRTGLDGITETIRSWIEVNLSDPDLSPPRIASANHISVRYLHKLFRGRGTTVGEYVRHRRLERIKQDLREPGFVDWTVAAVGARWGITDGTQLGRVFRVVEGMPPGEWRREHATTPASLSEGRGAR